MSLSSVPTRRPAFLRVTSKSAGEVPGNHPEQGPRVQVHFNMSFCSKCKKITGTAIHNSPPYSVKCLQRADVAVGSGDPNLATRLEANGQWGKASQFLSPDS